MCDRVPEIPTSCAHKFTYTRLLFCCSSISLSSFLKVSRIYIFTIIVDCVRGILPTATWIVCMYIVYIRKKGDANFTTPYAGRSIIKRGPTIYYYTYYSYCRNASSESTVIKWIRVLSANTNPFNPRNTHCFHSLNNKIKENNKNCNFIFLR